MRPLGVVELQGPGQRFQNAFGDPAQVPALEPGVVGDAYSGEDRDLLPAQPGDTSGAVGRQADIVRHQLRAPRGQALSDLGLGVHQISLAPRCVRWGTLPVLPSTSTLTLWKCVLSWISVPSAPHRTEQVMKHISLGELDISRIGLGTMAMSGYYLDPSSSDAESIRTIQRALELGVTHIDTAEIYGPYANEELVGRALEGGAATMPWWRRSSAWSRTPAQAPECSTAARRTSAPPSRAR